MPGARRKLISRVPFTTRVRADFADGPQDGLAGTATRKACCPTRSRTSWKRPWSRGCAQRLPDLSTPSGMSKPPEHLTLTRNQERLIDASAAHPRRAARPHRLPAHHPVPVRHPVQEPRRRTSANGTASRAARRCASRPAPPSTRRPANSSSWACPTARSRGWC